MPCPYKKQCPHVDPDGRICNDDAGTWDYCGSFKRNANGEFK